MSVIKLLKRASIITSVLILLCIPLMGCSDEPVTVEIYSPEDGVNLSVNVRKVVGAVSSPKATVQINGTEAKVSEDGSFYAYIDLAEGENTIKVEAVRGNATGSDTITVNFTPALAMRLDIEYDSSINYLTTPLTVTGFVSNAEAYVTVNGNAVSVSADGSFTTQMQLNENSQSVTAVAELDGKEDSYSYLILVGSEGHLNPVPGWSLLYVGWTIYENSIRLEAGETKSFDVKKDIRRNVMVPTDFNWRIYAVDDEYQNVEISAPEGLEVNIEPAAFTLYPNTTYILPLTVAASSEVEPGTYLFKLEGNGDGWQSGWIEITVE